MKHIALIAVLATCALTACDKKTADKKPVVVAPTMMQTAPPIAPGTPMPPGHPDISGAMNPTATLSGSDNAASDAVQTQSATVISSIDIPQFTYLEVKQGKETRWLAAATLSVKQGDIIDFDDGATMHNFKSAALSRTFPVITFVNHATVAKNK